MRTTFTCFYKTHPLKGGSWSGLGRLSTCSDGWVSVYGCWLCFGNRCMSLGVWNKVNMVQDQQDSPLILLIQKIMKWTIVVITTFYSGTLFWSQCLNPWLLLIPPHRICSCVMVERNGGACIFYTGSKAILLSWYFSSNPVVHWWGEMLIFNFELFTHCSHIGLYCSTTLSAWLQLKRNASLIISRHWKMLFLQTTSQCTIINDVAALETPQFLFPVRLRGLFFILLISIIYDRGEILII